MNLIELCELLELPNEVVQEIEKCKNRQNSNPDKGLYERLQKPECWEQSIVDIQKQIVEDPFGFGILAQLLDCACHTYEEYGKMGIPDSVFISTMKFCTRFIKEHKRIYGYYSFTWAWWFPRQLSMKEFRIGELEYEFVDSDKKKINIHIPADAHMEPGQIKKSMTEYQSFLQKYYPEWEDTEWYCESWLLSPMLSKLLPKDSNILLFQELFELENVDYENMAVLDWVFPGEKGELTNLSENTSLQRNMKRFLLDGNKVGWAKGHFIK